MAELTLRRRPRYTVRRPTRGRAGVPRIPAPTLAGEGEVGTVVKRQIQQKQEARWQEAKLAVSRLSETNPVAAAKLWMDFLNRELREHGDLYPEGSADRASIEGEIVLAEREIAEAQRTMSGAELEAQLATGGLSDEEKIQLLKQKLATLPVGSEEYYNTLAQLRELEAAAGERGAGEAWNNLVGRIGNDMQDLEAAFQGGKISGKEYDKRMMALYEEYFREAKKRGETVPDSDRAAYTKLQSRAKIDPKLIYDYYDINPETGAYERVRTTKHRLTEQKKGIVELQDYDPTTGKSTAFPVAVSSRSTSFQDPETGELKTQTELGFVNPESGEWVSGIKDWKGEDIELATLFKGDPSGTYMRTATVFKTDPATGQESPVGFAFATPGRPGGSLLIDEPGGQEAAEAKISAFWRQEGKKWEPLPKVSPVTGVTKALLKLDLKPAQRPIAPVKPLVETGRVVGAVATPVARRPVKPKALVKAEAPVLPSIAKTLRKKKKYVQTRHLTDIKEAKRRLKIFQQKGNRTGIFEAKMMIKKLSAKPKAKRIVKPTPKRVRVPKMTIGKKGLVTGVKKKYPSFYKPPKQTWGQKISSGISRTFKSVTSGVKKFFGW